MTSSLPGRHGDYSVNLDREFVNNMRRRRPGFDQVRNLVQRYDKLSQQETNKLTEVELTREFIVPLFEALEWEVVLQSDAGDVRADLILTYKGISVPVEVKRSASNLHSAEEQIRAIAGRMSSRWTMITSFERVLILDFDLRKTILETSPERYISDDSPEHEILAAEIFYERIAKAASRAGKGEGEPPPRISGVPLDTRREATSEEQSSLQRPGSKSLQFDVFLAFHRSDIEFARRLNADLTKNGLRVWFDDTQLKPGDLWEERLMRGLESSATLAVLVSPDAMKSEWVNRLIQRAIQLADQDGTLPRIIPVLYRDTDLPAELATRLWVDFRDSANYEQAIVILIGGITGKPLGPGATLPLDPPVTSDTKSATPAQPPPSSASAPMDVPARGLSDATSEKGDLLGFGDYAQALADFITTKDTEKPLTIAIDAAWGMGKTTLMRMLDQKLKAYDPTPLTVWFDAWTYDKEESLWAAMVLAILEQIRSRFTRRQRLKLWWNLNQRRFDKPTFASSVIRSLMFVVGAFVLGVILTAIASLLNGPVLNIGFKDLSDYIKFLGSISLAGFIPLLYTIFKDLLKGVAGPFDLKLGQYIREPDYKERVGFLAKFKKDYEWVIESVASNPERPLVVFIDDLDRCAPPKPAEIVEAINLLLDAKNCVFVIGMDSKMVAASLEVKYKELTAYVGDTEDPGGLTLGQRFLEKIYQISFQIPRAESHQVDAFIGKLLGHTGNAPVAEPSKEQVKEAAGLIQTKQEQGLPSDIAVQEVSHERPDLAGEPLTKAKQELFVRSFDQSDDVFNAICSIKPYLQSNPRKIKRFINRFRLQALIANRRDLLKKGLVHLDVLAKWLVIAMRWPDVLDVVATEPRFIECLKEARRLRGVMRSKPDDTTRALLDGLLGYRSIKRYADAGDLAELLDGMSANDIASLNYYIHLAQLTQDSAPLSSEEVKQKTAPALEAA